MSDRYEQWRAALDGNPPPMHEDDPWCGFFRIRDRRGLNKDLAPIKRPWIACAIWEAADGSLLAERAGEAVPVEYVWPYCAKNPIPYETYQFWRENERWPGDMK